MQQIYHDKQSLKMRGYEGIHDETRWERHYTYSGYIQSYTEYILKFDLTVSIVTFVWPFI
jgi:hypothetical protein